MDKVRLPTRDREWLSAKETAAAIGLGYKWYLELKSLQARGRTRDRVPPWNPDTGKTSNIEIEKFLARKAARPPTLSRRGGYRPRRAKPAEARLADAGLPPKSAAEIERDAREFDDRDR
jgi:hypothetical protein